MQFYNAVFVGSTKIDEILLCNFNQIAMTSGTRRIYFVIAARRAYFVAQGPRWEQDVLHFDLSDFGHTHAGRQAQQKEGIVRLKMLFVALVTPRR